jgi:hypothetical protein
VNFDNTIIKQLDDKGFVVSKVRGVSMWPLLNQKNTSVYIEKSNDYKKYDCILFMRQNSDIILHRILKVEKDYLLVCGDNQAYIEKVNSSQIKGKLIEYYKNGKTRQLTGFFYHLYLRSMLMTRPFRFLRDIAKKVVKKVFKKA